MKGVPNRDLYKFTVKDAIRIARELGYGEEVIAKIKCAKNEEEITRILRDARLDRI